MLLAIINGKVLDGAGHTWEKANVLAENGKIKAAGPDVAVPEGAQVIDAAGCWVTPGFVEPHTHISLMGEPQTRGGISDVNESIDPVTAQIRAIDAFDPCNMSIASFLTNLCAGNKIYCVNYISACVQPVFHPTQALLLTHYKEMT